MNYYIEIDVHHKGKDNGALIFELDLKLECHISDSCPFIVEDFEVLKAYVFDDSTGDEYSKLIRSNKEMRAYMADKGGYALFYNELMKALDNDGIEYEYVDFLHDIAQEQLTERKQNRYKRTWL
jgi:hypothetical protein